MSNVSTSDSRKSIRVKGVVPIHYTLRSIEQFSKGDEAWISFDAKKALPVIVVDRDRIYYSVRSEKPTNAVTSTWALRLDEVRSTPELACENCVTL